MAVWTGVELLSYDFDRVNVLQMHKLYLFHSLMFFLQFWNPFVTKPFLCQVDTDISFLCDKMHG